MTGSDGTLKQSPCVPRERSRFSPTKACSAPLRGFVAVLAVFLPLTSMGSNAVAAIELDDAREFFNSGKYEECVAACADATAGDQRDREGSLPERQRHPERPRPECEREQGAHRERRGEHPDLYRQPHATSVRISSRLWAAPRGNPTNPREAKSWENL